ncbi:MAG: hypothetical protein IJX22_03255, partial [Opitutales bacterium]|nr:hypothetical protein [Opitutales bacterium]
MHKFKYALPVAALLSACNPGATAETVVAQTEAPAPQAQQIIVPAAPAEADAPATAESVPAPDPVPVSGDFTVTKVVPEDFTPAAFNIFTTGNMRFRVEFFGTDVFRI